MMRLPAKLTPSEFLCLEDLPEYVDDLLNTARYLWSQGSCSEAERRALDALEASQKPGAQISRAAALVHLAGIHLAMGRLSDALGEARKAHRLFANQPSRYQRHNEAVAAYATGLGHQSVGSRADALRWYEKADELFDRVSVDWVAVNASSSLGRCRRAQQWVRALIRALTRNQSQVLPDCTANIWLPVLQSEDESDFALAQLEVERYVVAGTLRLEGKSYRIELLQGQPWPSLQAGAEYYAREVPSHALNLLKASQGDYALILRQEDLPEDGLGVVETLSGPEFGHFRREKSGEISFVRPNTKIIGGKDIDKEMPVGSVTALLRRT
jgi:tetratricopeptide (TPR) repeat protein